MQFSKVIGQTKIKQQLIADACAKKIPHAQLFYGKEGSGKLALALAYAQYLNCETPSNHDSCGKCFSCIKTSKLIHPDLHFSFPVINKGGSKPPISKEFIQEWRQFLEEKPYGNIDDWLEHIQGENKGANITKEECKDIILKLSLKAYEAKYKIMLIWLPEFLGNNANSLLKVLEEPTSNTIFLLVTENKDLILNTVISRTQTIHIPPIDRTSIADQIKVQFQKDEEKSQWISNISEGNYRKARLLALEEGQLNDSVLKEWLNICYKSKPSKMVDWSESMAKESRMNQMAFLNYSAQMLRHAILNKYGKTMNHSESDLKLAESLIKLLTFNGLEELSKKISLATRHIERNANPKILFLNLSIDLSKLLKKSA